MRGVWLWLVFIVLGISGAILWWQKQQEQPPLPDYQPVINTPILDATTTKGTSTVKTASSTKIAPATTSSATTSVIQ